MPDLISIHVCLYVVCSCMLYVCVFLQVGLLECSRMCLHGSMECLWGEISAK